MANLTIVKDGQTYLVTDAGTGEVVISTTDPTLANTFAAAGDTSPQAIAIANAQTINYQGGVDTQPTSPQFQNEYGDFYTPVDPVPLSEVDNFPADVDSGIDVDAQARVEDPVPLSEIDNSPDNVNPDINAEVRALVEDPVPLSNLDRFPEAPNDDIEAFNTQLNQDLDDAANATEDFLEIPAPVDPEEDPVVANEGFVETDPGFYTFAEDIPESEAEEQELVPFPEPDISESDLARDPDQYTPEQLDAIAAAEGVDAGDGGQISDQSLFDQEAVAGAASITQGFINQARQQQTIANQRRQVNNGDWRVRLRLAPSANYLYKAPSPGIMQPLSITDGVLFPYLPTIDTAYKADYDAYTLTHSNYKGYFYKGSYVDAVNLRCPFTAQSSSEANYLLAVITFFKSVTKMFYGQDAQRGAPPPLVFLSGLGEYQFNEHPCVVSQFNLNLPTDVDYIRAGSPNNVGINLTNQRARQGASIPGGGNLGRLSQLLAQGISKGAISNPPPPPTLGLNSPTYVPTKMEISITLLPIQSRKQVSKQFSVKEFANGNLIKGGFW